MSKGKGKNKGAKAKVETKVEPVVSQEIKAGAKETPKIETVVDPPVVDKPTLGINSTYNVGLAIKGKDNELEYITFEIGTNEKGELEFTKEFTEKFIKTFGPQKPEVDPLITKAEKLVGKTPPELTIEAVDEEMRDAIENIGKIQSKYQQLTAISKSSKLRRMIRILRTASKDWKPRV